jgi:hypothetical protein
MAKVKPEAKEVMEFDYSDVDFNDPANPQSLVNLLPPYLANPINAIPEQILLMSEDELYKAGKCGVIESKLRQAFWMEYNHSLIGKKKLMAVSNIFTGICSKAYLRECFNNSFKLAYILRPPANLKVALHEMLEIGLSQIRDILVLPHIDDKGKFDASHAALKLKAMETIMSRLMGGVVQRVEQKNLNVSVDANPKDIEAEIKELEDKLQSSQGRLIDVQKRESEEAGS